jgi:hypothetical protein
MNIPDVDQFKNLLLLNLPEDYEPLLNNSKLVFKDTGKYSYYVNKETSEWGKLGLTLNIHANKEIIKKWRSKISNVFIKKINKPFISNCYVISNIETIVDFDNRFSFSDEINDRIKAISNRSASFNNMSTEEKLEELNNLIESILKSGSKYTTIDENNYFGLLSNKEIKSFRDKTQCFRHASDDEINKRNNLTNEDKNFLIFYGEMVIKSISIYYDDKRYTD